MRSYTPPLSKSTSIEIRCTFNYDDIPFQESFWISRSIVESCFVKGKIDIEYLKHKSTAVEGAFTIHIKNEIKEAVRRLISELWEVDLEGLMIFSEERSSLLPDRDYSTSIYLSRDSEKDPWKLRSGTVLLSGLVSSLNKIDRDLITIVLDSAFLR